VLFIVRHGRTAANALGLLQGRVDNPLDDQGRKQAEQIAEALGQVDRVVSSPLRRATQTAEALGQTPLIDERWVELDYGDWDARPVADITPQEWAAWREDDSFCPPKGESLADLDQRVAAACEELIPQAESENVAVFTHVSPIKSAVGWALGVSEQISWRLNVAQAQITRIAIRGNRPILTAFNETAHLETKVLD
tara:strand:+ start:484 stop:1068 length:585 start_codon:yes stop_codon:yes gene_type:complete